jgi:MoxR-like ATPase
VLQCPIETVIGASNELPEEGAGLEALADRFLFRRWVSYLADRDAWWDVVASPAVKVAATLDRADLAVLRAALPAVDVSGLRAAFGQLKDRLTREAGIVVSDRRWRALMGAVRAEAVLNGRVVAETSDLMILTDAIWLTPDQRPAVAAIVAACVSPDAEAAQKIVDAAIEAFATLDADGLRKGHGPAVTAAMRLRKLLVDATGEIGRLNQSGPVGEMAARVKAMRDQVARTVADAMTA